MGAHERVRFPFSGGVGGVLAGGATGRSNEIGRTGGQQRGCPFDFVAEPGGWKRRDEREPQDNSGNEGKFRVDARLVEGEDE